MNDNTWLTELALAALNATGDGREQRVHTLLGAVMALDPQDAGAPGTLDQLLQVEGLERLVGSSGQDVRSASVEALLRTGFPHALHVMPEDLAHLRRTRRDARWRARFAFLGAMMPLGMLLVLGAHPDEPLVPALAALTGLAGMLALTAPGRWPNTVGRWTLGALVLPSLVGICIHFPNLMERLDFSRIDLHPGRPLLAALSCSGPLVAWHLTRLLRTGAWTEQVLRLTVGLGFAVGVPVMLFMTLSGFGVFARMGGEQPERPECVLRFRFAASPPARPLDFASAQRRARQFAAHPPERPASTAR